jgi:hypothetical protein
MHQRKPYISIQLKLIATSSYGTVYPSIYLNNILNQVQVSALEQTLSIGSNDLAGQQTVPYI